MNIDNIYIQI